MKSQVFFASDKLGEVFDRLKQSRSEDKMLYEWINRAMNDLAGNAFCGIQLPKRLIPKEYVSKYGIDNLWKYNLPNA